MKITEAELIEFENFLIPLCNNKLRFSYGDQIKSSYYDRQLITAKKLIEDARSGLNPGSLDTYSKWRTPGRAGII